MKSFYQKYQTFIPALVLLLVGIYGNFTHSPTLTLYQNGNMETGYNMTVSLSVILSAFTCLIYFVFRKLYRYVLFGVLFLGFFNIVHFAGSTTYYVKFGALQIAFQPTIMLVAALTYLLFFRRINRFLSGNRTSEEPADSTIADNERESRVATFMNRFAGYTTEQLTEIEEGEKYSDDAKEAAQRLLNKTQNPAPHREHSPPNL